MDEILITDIELGNADGDSIHSKLDLRVWYTRNAGASGEIPGSWIKFFNLKSENSAYPYIKGHIK